MNNKRDVKRILAKVKGTAYEVPITLACYGMRRSEIRALRPEDIEGDIVHINKTCVLDENKFQRIWLIKSENRDIYTKDTRAASQSTLNELRISLEYQDFPFISRDTTSPAKCRLSAFLKQISCEWVDGKQTTL